MESEKGFFVAQVGLSPTHEPQVMEDHPRYRKWLVTTPPKSNECPLKNQWLQDVFPIETGPF